MQVSEGGENMLSEEMREFIQDHEEEALELLKELAQIPAPSNQEEKRAKFCRDWLERQGAQGVYMDEAFNVIYPVDIHQAEEIDVYMAHLDVVFPDTEALPLTECDGKIYCPGIGDDTACVVCLLMAAKYIAGKIRNGEWEKEQKGFGEQQKKNGAAGMLLVCNSGEEGLGNLKGVKAICRGYGERIRNFCTFDSELDKIVNRAVGSKRYRIRIATEGGHSFGDFGKDNAIEKMAGIIEKLYRVQVPEGGKTTYNVGLISGGTGVNVIAQNAEILYEFRSDTSEHLQMMEQHFEKTIWEEKDKGLDIEYEVIGLRPCGKGVDAARQERLTVKAMKAVKNVIGKNPEQNCGSTDCNIPLSMGIPSVCVGCYYGHGAHTREEYIEKDSLILGIQVAFEMIFGE